MDEQEEKNKSESFLKEQAEKGKDKVKDEAKKQAKKKIIQFLAANPEVLAVLLPIILAVIVIVGLILWAGFVDIQTEESASETNDAKKSAFQMSYSENGGTTSSDGSTTSGGEEDTTSNADTITIKPNTETGSYEIAYKETYSDEQITELREELEKETSRSLDDLSDYEIAIIGALDRNGLTIDDWNISELKCFPTFIKAEACTQYLDLRSNKEKFDGQEETIENYKPLTLEDLESKGEEYVPGCILIQRTNIHGDSDEGGGNPTTTKTILEYISESEFNSLYDSNKEEVLNYFTLNSDGEIVIAVLQSKKNVTVTVDGEGLPEEINSEVQSMATNGEEYTYSKVPISYSSIKNDYAMPFELLVDLLATLEDTQFCLDLANCALESKIVINIQEEETYTHNVETREYTVYNKDSKYIDYLISNEVQIESGSNYLLQNGEYYNTNGVDDEGNACTNYYEPQTPTVTIDTKLTEITFTTQIPIYADCWRYKGELIYGDLTKSEETTEQDPEAEKGTYGIISETTITDSSQTATDSNVSAFKETKQNAYKEKIVIPEIKVTQNNNIIQETFDSDFASTNMADSYTISISPQSAVASSSLTSRTFYADDSGNTNLPSSIRVTTNTITADESKGTQTIPNINIVYNLSGKKYTTQTTKDKLAECTINKLYIKEEQKTDVDAKINTTVTEYKSGTPVSQVDLYDGTDEKFLKAYGDNSKAQSMMKSVYSWLWDMMNNDETTADFVKWIKYFLYKFDGTDYGVTEMTLDGLFNASNISSFGGSIYGSTTEEKVWYALKDCGYSEVAIAAVMGNIYGESGFNAGAIESNGEGYGLCQWSFGRKEQLINYAKSKGTDWTDVDTQIEFLLGEINSNGGADGYASYQMSGTHYGYTYSSWKDATDIAEATKAFMAVFERPNMNKAHTDNRVEAANNYYNQFHGKERSGGEYSTGSGQLVGTFTSQITGRTFTILNQTQISGWGEYCNRCVAISILSGYSTDSIDTLRSRTNGGGIMINTSDTNSFFDPYLVAKYGTYSVDNIRAALTSGQYIAMRFNSYANGKSGQTYATAKGHWIGIIGYKVENGTEQIFISDSAYGASGWHDIDEFESSSCKSTRQYFVIVSEKN